MDLMKTIIQSIPRRVKIILVTYPLTIKALMIIRHGTDYSDIQSTSMTIEQPPNIFQAMAAINPYIFNQVLSLIKGCKRPILIQGR